MNVQSSSYYGLRSRTNHTKAPNQPNRNHSRSRPLRVLEPDLSDEKIVNSDDDTVDSTEEDSISIYSENTDRSIQNGDSRQQTNEYNTIDNERV